MPHYTLYHKAIQGCPRMDEDFNVVEGLDEVKHFALKSPPSMEISGYCGLLASLAGWRGSLVPQDNQPHAPSWCEEAANQKGGGKVPQGLQFNPFAGQLLLPKVMT